MKVGILTFHFSDNYGAALQAYALRRWFVERGHDADFIDYKPTHVEHGGEIVFPTSVAKFRANLKAVYLRASSLANERFGNKDQKRKFDEFRALYLGVKKGAYPEADAAVLQAAESLDMIVAGSDQIWSPSRHYGFDQNYFLSFAKCFHGRKVSYAASFGRDTLSQVEIDQLPPLLANFDAISVREASGVHYVKEAIGVEPSDVPDPTLLHEDYADLLDWSEMKVKGDYIFCYALRSPDNIRKTAELVSKRMSCKIVSAHNPHRRWLEIGETIHPDPADWVSLIKNARFVVTNSFHGTVFSLLFCKPFIVAGLTGSRSPANARALNLLRNVGLEHRFSESFSQVNVDALVDEEIDWIGVKRALGEMRQKGHLFLERQLKNAVQ